MPALTSRRRHAVRWRVVMPYPCCTQSVALTLAVCALLMAGCSRGQVPVPASHASAADALSSSPEATSAPTVAPSATVALTSTPAPRPSPTPTWTPTAVPTPEPLSATVTVARPRLAQGCTDVVRVVASRPSRVTGHLGDQTLRFVPVGDSSYLALVGIHALAAEETLPLVVEVASEEGLSLSLNTVIEVIAGDYGEETIYLDPEVGKLLDPAISEPENRLMGEVWATFTPEIRWTEAFQWPVVGPFTSLFGTRRSYGGAVTSYHAGIDIDGETGDLVVAAANGVVVLAEPLQVRGNAVVIDHGAGVLTGYFHLDGIAVEKGQAVKAGEALGTMGATGLVTGSHLHWELHVGGVAVDPADWTEMVPMP